MNIINPAALDLLAIQGLIQTVVFLANCILYGMVWLAIIQSSRRLRSFDNCENQSGKNAISKQNSNTKTAKVRVNAE